MTETLPGAAIPNPLDEAAITAAVDQAVAAIAAATTLDELKAVRLAHTGDKSALSLANREIGGLAKDQKAAAGNSWAPPADASTKRSRTAPPSSKPRTTRGSWSRRPWMSLRLRAAVVPAPATRFPPCRNASRTSSSAWAGKSPKGPEVESEWFNFDALNFKPDHPAREMQDTFFVEPPEAHLLMRTHTSPVQVRSMLERELPIYVLCPGKVFRTDELDATHTPVFHQFEGLAIDKKLSMADLRGTLEHFARQMFGDEAQIRLRPNYFPFTEPSAELDIWHPGAKGGPGWIEWGGCGMVNPNVLRAAGIDPDIYSGFAFGMGIERTLMFRNEVGDMRDMIEGDVRFSEHFGMEI